ncbi:MAG: universal stress protein [Pseudomonadota bacterium]|nr:universal stress protein [Pseudomonadota bacterium]
MTLKRILVHYDGTARADRALDAALQLAEAQDAHLIGCAIEMEPRIPTYAAAQIPADVVDALIQDQHRLVAEARTRFEARIRNAGRIDRSEFAQGRGDMVRTLCRVGRGCDLVVVGQAKPDEEPAEIEELPDNLVLAAGRPVLIVPYIGQKAPVGGHVLLCWTDTREAARALADALPLFNAASEVTILTAGTDTPADEYIGDDPARYLAAHGVRAEVRRASSAGIDAGTAILNEASDTGADLIVMGAYGHSRLRETIMGGATRTVLKGMTAPVLMSH